MNDKNDAYQTGELTQRKARARAMGGADKIKKQTAKGRLTARERIDKLLDKKSFDEQGLLAHSDLPEAADKSPADGKICGWGEIEKRPVFVSADDVTVMAGAGGRVGVGKQFKYSKYAYEKGMPCIHLGDAGGARVPDIMGATGMMSMVYPIRNAKPRNRRVPQIVVIMGECFGGAAWTASVSDIVIQVKGTAMCVGGPSILEIATGEKAATEELGGWELHAKVTGQADLFAGNDEEALQLARRALGYFPDNFRELPPVAGNPVRKPEKASVVTDLVPADPRATYDMRKVLAHLADLDSVLELRPLFDPSLITALVRFDGHVTGVLANNPKFMAGAMGPGACEKACAFIALCDSFHIPLLFLHDTPGFFVSKAAEQRAMPLRIMNFIEALHQSSVPRISVVIRKSYGMAHCNMSGGNMNADTVLAWPIADVSFMAPAVAVNVVYGRKLKTLDDPETARAAYVAELSRANAPWEAAGLNLIDKVIEPAKTRDEIIAALNRARGPDREGQRSQRHLANWPRMC